MIANSEATATVNLQEFFSICSQAIINASKIIHTLYFKNSLNTQYKNGHEPYTEADTKVQVLIVKSLLAFWPSLKIIGEEDETSKDSTVDIDISSFKKDSLPKEIFKGLEPDTFNVEDAIIWVDPIDGTYDFVRGKLDSITTLIGISINSKARIGVIGKYFKSSGTSESGTAEYSFEPKCYFGHASYRKVFVLQCDGSNKVKEVFPKEKEVGESVKVIATFSAETRETVGKVLGTDVFIQGGATGNEFVWLLEGVADVYLRIAQGPKKWDTCAGEALVRALGGVVEDLDGRDLLYYEGRETWVHENGGVAYVKELPKMKGLKLKVREKEKLF